MTATILPTVLQSAFPAKFNQHAVDIDAASALADAARSLAADHIADTAGAHDAAAITVDPTGFMVVTGMDVQTALAELDAASGGGTAAGTSFDDTGLVLVTGADVQAALEATDAALLAAGATPPSTWKDAVRVATAAVPPNAPGYSAGVLTATTNGALTIDGVALAVGDRWLDKDSATGSRRGIYVVTDAGSAGSVWVSSRASDFDSSGDVKSGLAVRVSVGTANASTEWVLTTTGAIVLDTTALVFTSLATLMTTALSGAFAPLGVGCSLTKSAAQSIAVGASQIAVTFDGETYDDNAFHDNSTNPSRITIPSGFGGRYLFGGAADFDSLVSGKSGIVSLRVNGSSVNTYRSVVMASTSAKDIVHGPVRPLVLAAGDYVELTVVHDDTSARDVRASVNGTSFWCMRIG